jgi:hypothetical protein
VGGGQGNTASRDDATVAGGLGNTASLDYATVAGGVGNTASGFYATVGGGQGNTASGQYAMVAGGYQNTASGTGSFAAGVSAEAGNDGSFVWADDSGGSFASTADNQFCVRASGGILFAGDLQLAGGAAYHNLSLSGGNALGYLYGSFPALADGIHLGYNYYYDASGNGHPFNAGGATSRLTVGYGFISLNVGAVDSAPTTQRLLANASGVTVSGTFSESSDRNAKQGFAAISPAQMLDKVTRLPISQWSYKEDAATRHVGPMAQDFYSIFSLGTDDKHIAPIDEGGVALAAIQGLNEKLEAAVSEKEAEIEELEASSKQLEAENVELKTRLERLEQLVEARKRDTK